MDLVIFDLDGTLIDSSRDLANSVNATRAHLHLPPLENETVYSYVGNGAPVLIRRALGPDYTDDEVQNALLYFLGYYRDHMLDHTVLYPGVREVLDRLRDSGVRMAVLTNKPVRFSQAIIDGLGLHAHFRRVYGGNSFDQKKPHPIGIETLMTECGATRDETLMVGDSSVDVQTARNANVKVCGVTWGFQPETFAECPPDFLIHHPEELAERVTGHG
ncbi:MAG TPA: HAD-IA family hydrolase [Bryobacteraceae bacterium]|nr:HAD-IA family hydrolase [Bryobacteraceae bacterium]